MPGFPVNLDLTAYFNDLRKYSSVFVNLSKCKDVGDVENHIKSVFKFEDNICLINKKFLLPKSEDVQILQQYDILKVQKCDFYDTQIHKIKRVSNNIPCDQNALNLIQSEKSIDLSCRPKQRIKTNCSQSPCMAGVSTFSKENEKSRDSAWSFSSVNSVFGIESKLVPKEKQKFKKKKLTLNNEDSDKDDEDSNILDMSVKKSKRRKHENCFSTDEKNETEESHSPVRYGENACTVNIIDGSAEYPKKSKKRKKYHSQCTDEDVDLANTCWNNLVCDNSFNVRGHKKKSKKSRDNSLSTDINGHSDDVMENVNDLHNSAYEECLTRKKPKKCKKLSESKVNHDSLDNQYYQSSTSLKTKTCISEKVDYPEKYEREDNICESSKTSEDSKKRLTEKTSNQTCEETPHNDSLHANDNNDSSSINMRLASSNHDGDTQGDDSQDIKQNSEFFSDFSDSHPKRKRKRKHNRKKKREALLYVSAVGPALDQLATRYPQVNKKPASDGAKHIFFSEENLPEEIPNQSQSLQGESSADHTKAVTTQEVTAQNSWQSDLLKLMSSKSKPAVFHRKSPTTVSERCNNLSLQPQPGPSTENHVRDLRNCNGTSSMSEVSKENQTTSEGCVNHNGEVKTENTDANCTENNGCGSRGGLPDIIRQRAIPNDLQNINLSDYPIIDKVVTGDLILFKVHKLNENNEPGVSKTILAKVNESSRFPNSISLQIMEGSDELDEALVKNEANDGTVTVELSWANILEPRLFYP